MSQSLQLVEKNRKMSLVLKTLNSYDLYDTLLSLLGGLWMLENDFVNSVSLDFSSHLWFAEQQGMYHEEKFGPTWWLYYFKDFKALDEKKEDTTFTTLDGCLDLKKPEKYETQDKFPFYFVSEPTPKFQTLEPVCLSQIAKKYIHSQQITKWIQLQSWLDQQLTSFKTSLRLETKPCVSIRLTKDCFEGDALETYLKLVIRKIKHYYETEEKKDEAILLLTCDFPVSTKEQEDLVVKTAQQTVQEEWENPQIQLQILYVSLFYRTDEQNQKHFISIPSLNGSSPYCLGLYETICFYLYQTSTHLLVVNEEHTKKSFGEVIKLMKLPCLSYQTL